MNLRKLLESGWRNTLSFIGPVILLTLVYFIVMALSLGILAPVTTAGYMQSLLLAHREGRTPVIRDLFSEMSLFLPLFLFFIAAAAVTTIGLVFLVLPGIVVAAFITFATLYLMPLMTDRRLTITDAFKVSWEMAVRSPVTDQLALTVFYLIAVSLGGTVPLGFLVTQPFAVFLAVAAYEQRQKEGAEGKE